MTPDQESELRAVIEKHGGELPGLERDMLEQLLVYAIAGIRDIRLVRTQDGAATVYRFEIDRPTYTYT